MGDHFYLDIPETNGSARMGRKRSSGVHSAVSDVSRAHSGLTSDYPRSIVSSTSGYRSGLTSSSSPRGRGALSTATSRGTLRDEMTTTNSVISNGDDISRDMSLELEPFAGVNVDRPALYVWRVELRRLVAIEQNDVGFFHEGECYLVLNVRADRFTSLHFWLGQLSKQPEVEAVEEKATELDEFLNHASVCSREVQGHESVCFLRNFPDGVVYIEGKARMVMGRVSKYLKRLYVVRGRKFPQAACTVPSVQALDPTAAALLDGFPRMYLWIGSRCDRVSRIKAINLARRIRTYQRKGRAHIVVVDERDTSQNAAFVKKLHSGDRPPTDCLGCPHGNGTGVLELHRVSGDRVLYDMPLAATRPLFQKFLVTTDTFLLDQGMNTPLFVWVGTKADKSASSDAVRRGQAFLQHKEYPTWLSVCRVTEGLEPQQFKKVFQEWRDRQVDRLHNTRSYNVGNIERALCSRSDNRTVARISELWSDDVVLSSDGSTEVFRVEGESLDPPWDQPGVFLNSDCYVVWHRPANQSIADPFPPNVLFYWLGSRSDADRQRNAMTLTFTMADALKQALVVRVLDNKEPQCFFSVFHNSIVVYDQQVLAAGGDMTMYCVRECAKGSMRVQQVPAQSSSLHSSAVCIILAPARCILWYGKFAGGSERQFSKTMLGFLDSSRMYDYEIVMEGKEPPRFWDTIGPPSTYDEKYPQSNIHRRLPWLSLCSCDADGASFMYIPNFDQEDLTESDIFILDRFDQLYVWCGKAVSVESRQKLVPEYLKEYMSHDPPMRDEAELAVWIVSQGSEPEVFRRYFPGWGVNGYGGEETYTLARKRLRQENARIDVEAPMVDLTHTRVPKFLYDRLMMAALPTDVLPDHREHHLTDRNFAETLKLTRYEFYRLPEWKQAQILRSARLAYFPPWEMAARKKSKLSSSLIVCRLSRRPTTAH